MRHVDFSAYNQRYNDSDIERIASVCKNIASFNFCECCKLSDQIVFILSYYCCNIIELNIRGCVEVTDEGIDNICTGCPLIERLDISKCFRLTPHSMDMITNAYPKLKSINTSYCVSFRDATILTLTEKCPLIDTLHTSYITDKAFIKVMEVYGHQLQHLTLVWCNEISVDALHLIPTCCPNLITLCISFCEHASNEFLMYSIVKSCPKLIIFEQCGLRNVFPEIVRAIQQIIEHRRNQLPESVIREVKEYIIF